MEETIERKNIIITKNIQNKEQLFHYLAEYMVSQKEIDAKHQEAFEQALWSREQLSVTGVGNDVAIPTKGIYHPTNCSIFKIRNTDCI